jgi:hypothetical protein
MHEDLMIVMPPCSAYPLPQTEAPAATQAIMMMELSVHFVSVVGRSSKHSLIATRKMTASPSYARVVDAAAKIGDT